MVTKQHSQEREVMTEEQRWRACQLHV